MSYINHKDNSKLAEAYSKVNNSKPISEGVGDFLTDPTAVAAAALGGAGKFAWDKFMQKFGKPKNQKEALKKLTANFKSYYPDEKITNFELLNFVYDMGIVTPEVVKLYKRIKNPIQGLDMGVLQHQNPDQFFKSVAADIGKNLVGRKSEKDELGEFLKQKSKASKSTPPARSKPQQQQPQQQQPQQPQQFPNMDSINDPYLKMRWLDYFDNNPAAAQQYAAQFGKSPRGNTI